MAVRAKRKAPKNKTATVIETVNPANGAKLASYRLISWNEASNVAEKARETFRQWRETKVSERAEHLQALAKALRARKKDYARIMTEEMGKPIVQSEAEVEKCAWTAEVFADHAERWLADDPAKTDAAKSFVAFDPLGVILSIMPWNFPFWQAFRSIIPVLLVGNTSILRHSNVCPGSALAIEESIMEAGFPQGSFRTIISSHEVVSRLIESDLIQGASLTGSVEAGRTIGEVAGRSLKPCVLELGGSDPFIVLGDASVKEAARVGAEARLINSGQSCIAAKRFIVAKSVAEEFTSTFVEETAKKKVGDPMDRSTDVGPLVNRDAVKKLDSLARDAISKGAKALIRGGPRRGERGAYYDPAVLTHVTKKMRLMREEAFGPVAPIFVVDSDEEAIAVANETEFGLGASLWTSNLQRGEELTHRIESGLVFINALVKSDPRIPFGGVKHSGVGRELAECGLKEFVDIKSVSVFNSESQKNAGAQGNVE